MPATLAMEMITRLGDELPSVDHPMRLLVPLTGHRS
jgi:hypothetical protein